MSDAGTASCLSPDSSSSSLTAAATRNVMEDAPRTLPRRAKVQTQFIKLSRLNRDNDTRNNPILLEPREAPKHHGPSPIVGERELRRRRAVPPRPDAHPVSTGVGQRSKGHEDQLSEGFDTVCLVIWGYTFDDIDEDLLSVEDRRWYEEAEEADAVEFAEQHGYDLYIEEGTFCLLDDWDLFLAMILAKARGIPHPRECCGAEDQARGGALRREQEARRHQRPLSEISPASLDEKINDSAA